MKVLVANLGSTSFKYQLLDMDDGQRELARGKIERIGSPSSPLCVEIHGQKRTDQRQVADHAEAVRQCLAQLTDPQSGCLKTASEVSAIGFKAVHGGRVSGVQLVTDDVLDAMQEASHLAPAHNPPYIKAMRLLHEKLPEIPLVAAFETDFHASIPDRNRYYAVPLEWADGCLVKRWGFHGASHRYIATRTAELLGRRDLRIISCHLGGSSSLCAIRNGQSVANSFGTSAQSGLPHNNRVGDFDVFALPLILRRTGKTLEEVLEMLANQSGLAGLSGTSGDIRDVCQAAAKGSRPAQLALEVFASSVRHYLGAYLVELGGADVIVFTGGIGENLAAFRADVLGGLEQLGIVLDQARNQSAHGEMPIHADDSRVQVWVVPTNEELIVARQVKELLAGKPEG
jgi:acetate kinase